uniref:General transcription factor IIIC, polypeptide 2, beta n=1 Tax=Scophthalmus maximus TaxID=52904 RepID=A0A8D3C8W2_SCOMX
MQLWINNNIAVLTGQEKPSEQDRDLRVTSRGRQRKKNPKYSDYETVRTSPRQTSPRKSSRRAGRTPPKTTPAKIVEAKDATQQAANGEKEGADKTAQESDGDASEETPTKKSARARRTPSKKTPARKTPAKKTPVRKTARANGSLGTGEDGVVDAVPPEIETPKPKRKYVKKQPAQKSAAPVTEPPPCVEAEPEEQIEPGGRRRRSAAKAALKYLQILAKEVLDYPNDETRTGADSKDSQKNPKGGKERKGRKRKRPDDSDAEGDEDFVPGVEEVDDEEREEEEEEEEEAKESEDSDLDFDFRKGGRSAAVFQKTGSNVIAPNGLTMNNMRAVWNCFEATKKFREEHYSSWVFPEWVPSTAQWQLVPQSDLDKYLPQELCSAAFKVSREGLGKEETPLQSLNRFTAAPAHPQRWDTVFFTGGPVWAMEWCPTPDGAPATQYIAMACHRGMDEQHYVDKTYTGTGLVQLWDVGKLEYNSSPDAQPAFAYGLAQDKGFIWNLKWCPAGGWELPSCSRNAPFLPRLGLLAVATSNSVVTIYSLPHPDALRSKEKLPDAGKDSQQLPIYKAEGVLTLKLGSFRAPHHEKSGQVLSMDWLPEKPHNVIAIGFYDGVVGFWDLTTKSSLLRVRELDRMLSLLPYRCLRAHDHAVRALAFCPASRYLLTTAGEDRYVKTWDLRRLDDPLTVQKRYLTNEIYWPLHGPGVIMAQDAGFVPKGSHGVHYFDHFVNSIFAVPRCGSLWSISYTDWLNSVVTADSLGEVIFALLPPIDCVPPCFKRSIDRRFPVYFTSLEPNATTAEEQDSGSEGGEENDDESGREGRRPRRRGRNNKRPPLRFQTYKEAVKKYCLHHTDTDMATFAKKEKRALWKLMKDTEMKTHMNLDDMPLAALHKVRLSPNMSSHTWLASAGQTGLVRLNCLRTMIGSQVKDMISENQAQFDALYSPKDPEAAAAEAAESEVQSATEEL